MNLTARLWSRPKSCSSEPVPGCCSPFAPGEMVSVQKAQANKGAPLAVLQEGNGKYPRGVNPLLDKLWTPGTVKLHFAKTCLLWTYPSLNIFS